MIQPVKRKRDLKLAVTKEKVPEMEKQTRISIQTLANIFRSQFFMSK